MTNLIPTAEPKVTGGWQLIPELQATGSPVQEINEQAGFLRTRARLVNGDVAELHESTMQKELDERSAELAKLPVSDLLAGFADLGFAWRDIARMVAVSVPAVQKWRKGESITGENRLRLAKLAALMDMVQNQMVSDPASWFEVPLLGSSITPLDMAADGRWTLVLELAGDHSDKRSVLNSYKPDWQEANTGSAFETFVNVDGQRSIRSKE